MEHHKGLCLGPSQGDAPRREREPTGHRVLRHHSTHLDRGAGRIARLVLVGCLFVILAGGALLLQPSAVHATTRAPTLRHPLPPMVALHPKGVVQPVCTPVVQVVQVPVIKTVKIIRDGVVCVVKVVVPVTVKKIVLVCG